MLKPEQINDNDEYAGAKQRRQVSQRRDVKSPTLNPSALAVLAPLSDAVDRVPLCLLFLLQLLSLNLCLALVDLTKFKDNN